MHISAGENAILTVTAVNKCIRTAKDVKTAAKDLHNFTDWLFAHSFISADIHSQLVKVCGSPGKAIKKKNSEPNLANPSLAMMGIPSMPNGLVRPSNPVNRAEAAGKTLSKLSCLHERVIS